MTCSKFCFIPRGRMLTVILNLSFFDTNNNIAIKPTWRFIYFWGSTVQNQSLYFSVFACLSCKTPWSENIMIVVNRGCVFAIAAFLHCPQYYLFSFIKVTLLRQQHCVTNHSWWFAQNLIHILIPRATDMLYSVIQWEDSMMSLVWRE